MLFICYQYISSVNYWCLHWATMCVNNDDITQTEAQYERQLLTSYSFLAEFCKCNIWEFPLADVRKVIFFWVEFRNCWMRNFYVQRNLKRPFCKITDKIAFPPIITSFARTGGPGSGASHHHMYNIQFWNSNNERVPGSGASHHYMYNT